MGSITAQVADDGTPYGAAQALQVRASFRIGPYEAWTYPGKRSIAFVRVGERLNGSCACNQADCNVDQLESDMRAVAEVVCHTAVERSAAEHLLTMLWDAFQIKCRACYSALDGLAVMS